MENVKENLAGQVRRYINLVSQFILIVRHFL